MKTRILVLYAIGLYGCASAPVSDLAPGDRPELDTDEAGLWQAMERDEFTLKTSPAVIKDPGLQQYLESVLCQVAPDYCADIRLYVIPSPDFNAAMGPNGVMLIFTGLLLRVQNEAQLAAVMSHEVGHFVRRHSLQQMRAWRSRNAGLQTFAAILSAGASIASAQANSALAAGDLSTAVSRYDTASTIATAGSALLSSLQVWAIMSQLEYSRDQETESDDLGLDWMASAGYDPGVVDDLWQYMQAEDEASELGIPAYLRSHPLPEERMLRNRQRAAELTASHPDATAIHPDTFIAAIAPYRHAWLGSARAGLDRQSEELLIERQRQLGVDPGLVLFHEADILRKQGEPHQSNLALQTYQRATDHPHAPPEAFREIGLLQWDGGRLVEARSAFSEYLSRAPDAPDHLLIQSYVEELSE